MHHSQFIVEILLSGSWTRAGEIVLHPDTYNGATVEQANAAVQANLQYNPSLATYAYGSLIVPVANFGGLRVSQGAAWSDPE